jgi:hypothetical protein
MAGKGDQMGTLTGEEATGLARRLEGLKRELKL